MQSFKSSVKHTKGHFIFRFIIQSLVGIAIILAMHYFSWLNLEINIFLALIFILLIIDFLKTSNSQVIREITIDPDNRIISFDCFQFWKGEKIYKRSFDKLRIEIIIPKPTWLFSSPLIFFFKNQPTEFYLSNRKDRFSKKTINELIRLLDKLTRPVK